MQRKRYFLTTALGLAGTGMAMQGLVGLAQADSLFLRDRNISVLERARPEFAAAGIRAGQFIVKPRIDLGLGSTSNAFALSNVDNGLGLDRFEDESDLYVIFRPSVKAETLWSRHAITFDGYLETYTHNRFNSESITNAGAQVNGQVDVTRASALFGGVSFDRLHDQRSANSSAVLFEDPVAYTLARANLGYAHEVGRVQLKTRFDLAQFDYDDVDIVPVAGLTTLPDQDFRDRDAFSVLGQVSFAINPDVSVFFRTTRNFQEYGRIEDSLGRNRDSEGWTAEVGAEVDLTRLLRGTVAIGQFEQDYDDDAFETLEGLSVDAALEWFPTDLTTVTLTASRRTDESAVIAAGGYVATKVLARVDHELRRNFLVHAVAGVGEDDYADRINGQRQVFDTVGAGLGAKWFVNPTFEAGLDYTYESQDVRQDVFNGGFDTDYNVHELLLLLTFKR